MAEPREPEVVVALDVPGRREALELAARLPEGTWCKVGLELFAAEGPGVVRELGAAGHPVFLDLKLHDIPNTVAGAVRSAAGLGARLLTLHAWGGRAMMESAAGAAASADGDLELLAVTVLTSLDDASLAEVAGKGPGVDAAVARLARLARDAGLDGAVASVGECAAIKAACGEGFRVATPGIRLPGGDRHDQKRVATPAEAAAAGADFLVVGRAVREAEDPSDALRRVREGAVEGASGGSARREG